MESQMLPFVSLSVNKVGQRTMSNSSTRVFPESFQSPVVFIAIHVMLTLQSCVWDVLRKIRIPEHLMQNLYIGQEATLQIELKN